MFKIPFDTTRLASSAAALILAASAHAQPAAPNVVVIVSDDAGWADYGFMRAADPAANPGRGGAVPTPYLDALAGNGVVFTQGYTASVCSPSRAALATGQYGARIGYEQNAGTDLSPIDTDTIVTGLATESVTMWERMQSVGYRTAAVGKWHIGGHAEAGGQLGNRPQHQGVEEFRGLLSGSRSYFTGAEQANATNADRLIETVSDGRGNTTADRTIENDFDGRYVTDVFGDQSADYIRNRANRDEPFFLYSSFTAPHTPLQATDEDLAAIDALNDPAFTGQRRTYAAMQFAMDRNVGKIMQALRDPDGDPNTNDGIAENTMIVFINDNGGDCCDDSPNAAHNGALRNGKGSQYDGGIRVPIVVSGAGVSSAARGTVSTDLVHAVDVLPTIFAAGGGRLPDNNTLAVGDRIDGHDLIARINGEASGHESLFLRRYAGNQTAVREGDFKLIGRTGRGFELYNLADDPGEKNNLVETLSEKATALKRLLTDYDVQMDKPRHDLAAKNINQFDEFRFREGATAAANWSDADAWMNEAQSQPATLDTRDGYANTELTFRNRNGDYTATNDLQRVGGLEFMANAIRLTNRGPDENQGDGNATIDGLALLLTRDRAGNGPELELGSSTVNGTYTFELALNLLIYDDLAVTGDGSDRFVLSGSLSEYYRPGRSLTKSGESTLEMRGDSDLTGAVVVSGGRLIASHRDALGLADIHVVGEGQLVLREAQAAALPDNPPDFIHDRAAVLLNDLTTSQAALVLDFEGIETIGSLTINGETLGEGLYGSQTHATLFSGPGQLRVVPEPASAGLLGLLISAIVLGRRR